MDYFIYIIKKGTNIYNICDIKIKYEYNIYSSIDSSQNLSYEEDIFSNIYKYHVKGHFNVYGVIAYCDDKFGLVGSVTVIKSFQPLSLSL